MFFMNIFTLMKMPNFMGVFPLLEVGFYFILRDTDFILSSLIESKANNATRATM